MIKFPIIWEFQTVDKRKYVNSLLIYAKKYYTRNVRLLIVPKI